MVSYILEQKNMNIFLALLQSLQVHTSVNLKSWEYLIPKSWARSIQCLFVLSYRSEILISVLVQAGLNAQVPTLNHVDIQNMLFFFDQWGISMWTRNIDCHLWNPTKKVHYFLIISVWRAKNRFFILAYQRLVSSKKNAFLMTNPELIFTNTFSSSITTLWKYEACSRGHALMCFYYSLFVFSWALWMTHCWCPNGLNGVPVAEQPAVVAP